MVVRPLIFVIFGIGLFFIIDSLAKVLGFKKKRKLIAAGVIIFVILLYLAGAIYSSFQPDKQCLIPHLTSTNPPKELNTSRDFFDMGNYDYDHGDCKRTITDYTQAIKLNPSFTQAYNNRAYTYMRMQDYKDALPDLNRAIELRPNYVNALMNRGDIYNYYYNIDRKRAIKDYDKVLSVVKDSEQRRNLSVCGHRLLAQNNGWGPKIYFSVLSQGFGAGCK